MRLFLTFAIALTFATPASAHGLISHPKTKTREAIHASQMKNLSYARYLCHHGRHATKHWGCVAVKWLTREAAETAPAPVVTVGYWEAKQIAAAEVLGRESAGDPWPNCPDPYDGGGSWQDTVSCENSGNWLDSPGYYRCGLQFAPSWEGRFGRLCP